MNLIKVKRPIELAKILVSRLLLAYEDDSDFKVYRFQIINKFEVNHANGFLEAIKENFNKKIDVRLIIAWEYLRRNHVYQYSYFKVNSILTELKNEIINKPNDYFNDENLKKLCADNNNKLYLVYLDTLFGLNNAFDAKCPTSNEIPKFLYSSTLKSSFDVIDGLTLEKNIDNSNNKLPSIITVLFKLGVISEEEKIKFKQYKKVPSRFVELNISLMHDIGSQIEQIRSIYKDSVKDLNILNINRIDNQIYYIKIFDELNYIDKTSDVKSIRKKLDIDSSTYINSSSKYIDSSTYEDWFRGSIMYIHKRVYLDFIGLSNFRKLTYAKTAKILGIKLDHMKVFKKTTDISIPQ